MRSLKLFPCLMYRLNAEILITEVKGLLNINFVNSELLLNAFTFTSAKWNVDYERLELLRDFFLKLIALMNV